MAQTCGNLVVHLIFSTKQRKPLITPAIQSDLFAYLGGIVREMRSTALIINGIRDHVHLLILIRPTHSVAEIARVIKTSSSKWVHQTGHEFAWQWIRRVQRERIKHSGGHQVHRNAGRASQEAFIPGRVCGVPEEE